MNRFFTVASVAIAILSMAAVAPAQSKGKKKTTKHRIVRHTKVRKKATSSSGVSSMRGENGLVGIKLYDTGTRVVALYGTPDDIQAIGSGGGAGIGPAGGGGKGAPGGGGGAKGGGAGPGRGAGPGGASGIDLGISPDNGFEFGDEIRLQQGVPDDGPPGAARPGGPPGSSGPGGGPGGKQMGGGGGAGMAGGNGDRIIYTRWIYKRGPSQYAFVLDKFNRVIQCEAIGMADPKVHTSRGVGFGATFASLIKKYGAPDGYEINGGGSLIVRYLVKNKVAFRLARLGENKPQVVTGVVVAGGKM